MGSPCGWSHKWKPYKKGDSGYQQYVCRRCGKVTRRKVHCFGLHKWKMDGRTRPRMFRCQACGKERLA